MIRGWGARESVCPGSLWERDARQRRCVREPPEPLPLHAVRARGSTGCGGGEEEEEEEAGEAEGEGDASWCKGCIGFMQDRLISSLTAEADLLRFYVRR